MGFSWSVFSRVQDSRTVLQNPTPDAAHPTHFVADVDGTYTFRVVATDSTGLSSAPAFVKVRAAPPDAAASTVVTTVNASGLSPIADGADSVTITTTKAEAKRITVTVNPGPVQVVLDSHPVVTFIAGPATHFRVTTSALSVT